jgi:hypothetical protein
MTYEAGGDLHGYVTKYKLDETVARWVKRSMMNNTLVLQLAIPLESCRAG